MSPTPPPAERRHAPPNPPTPPSPPSAPNDSDGASGHDALARLRKTLKPLIISAPFGNYVQPEGATPTIGTFTPLRRPGRLWRIIKTVRYHGGIRAWTNKIGLRNPGIEWLAERIAAGRTRIDHAILSIHAFDDDAWPAILDRAAALRPLAIELNMSCPNVGHVNWPPTLFERAAAIQSASAGIPIIAKLPPVNYQAMLDAALGAGLRAFHCCNTLPVPTGGMSGKPLKPIALQCIADLRRRARSESPALDEALIIIGGGGITTPADIDDYARAGATHFAIGTKAFNPALLFGHAPLRPLIEHAARTHAGAPHPANI